MNLLAIETASTVCGVALFINDRLQDISEIDQPRVHAERLPVFISDLLVRNHVDPAEIAGIAVSSGPGSYTGLRIGMSLAKGLAFSHRIPLVPVPTLQSLEAQVQLAEEHLVCLHSHKNLVYAQKFARGVPAGDAMCVPISALEDLPVFGYGLKASGELAGPLTIVTPSAEHVGVLALAKFDEWKQSDLNQIQPCYLTEFNIRV